MPTLPKADRGEVVVVHGTIVSFPVMAQGQSRFYFDVHTPKRYSGRRFYVTFDHQLAFEHHVALGVPEHQFFLGEFWQLQLKLRPLNGFRNPGLANYGWTMAARGVYASATGKGHDIKNHHLNDAVGLFKLRQHIRHTIFQIPDGPGRALVAAIVLGDKTALTPEMRQVLAPSGLSHLLAVSGMHIGIMAGLGFWLGGRLWRVSLRVWYSDGIWWRCLTAVLLAIIYGLVSGMALSTQRALVALIIAAVWRLLFGVVHWAWSALCSLLVVLCITPLAPMTLDFWLSFGAIGLLLLGFNQQHQQVPPWLQFVKVQGVLTLGLLPAVALMGGQLSLWSAVLNAIAIPLLGLVMLPGAMLSVIAGVLGWFAPLSVLSWLFEFGFSAVQALMQGPWALLYTVSLTQVQGIGLILVALSLFVPLYRPLFVVAALLFLTLLLPNRPVEGEFWVDVLDVGQGNAIIIRTAGNTLLYDTGARWRSGRDAAQIVILPYLRARAVQQLDMMLISHEDNDHIGGADTLLDNIDVGQIRASFHKDAGHHLLELPETATTGHESILGCDRLQRWWKDGVLFSLFASDIKDSANNRSCILKIDNGTGAVLLPGDIEFTAEQSLLQSDLRHHLKSDLLIAPHHGSATSSSTGFINAVSPEIVVFTASDPSRFNHPHPTVVARYLERGAVLFNTGTTGAFQWRSENIP